MNSVRLKMVVMYLTLVFIVMAACGTFTVVSLRYTEAKRNEEDLAAAAQKIKEAVIDVFSEEEFQRELMNLTRPAANINHIEYNILDAGGARIIATNVDENPITVAAYSSSVIIAAYSGETKFQSWRKYPNHQGYTRQWMEYARPVAANGAAYILYLRVDAQSVSDTISNIIVIFLLGLLIALILAIVLGVFFADSVNKPIVLLTTKAKEFAQGSLDEDIEVRSNDEIGQLTQNFNDMARELNLTLLGLENEKNKMEIVLHNVTDGVLAYDKAGKLIHANHVCRELLGVTDINGLSFYDMLKHLGIKNDDAAAELQDSVLHINDRFINIVCSYYTGGKGVASGVILLLQDLTKHIMLDNMRKEFVANVSHELRTPLTTIKSYTETLLEELPDSGPDADPHSIDFLRTIDGETDRMTVLVNDLLELSRLDNKQLEFHMDTMSLRDLIAQNVAKHRHALGKSGSTKTIRFNPPNNEMPIDGDHERINQVVNNIITNSLRYSGDNAVVDITMEDIGERYRVSIRDNGMGIPQEDLHRIFERFYRVDKARSRELGGTGLGLSISKEIIEAHGGSLSASSVLGEGTTMVIELKKHED